MRKSNLLKRSLLLFLLSIIMVNTQAQTGLNFQGVARTSNNVILASQAITIKLSILQGSSTGTADYIETRRVTTNAQGLFTAVIGDTGAISTLGNFTTINWKLTPKFLKIEMDAAAGTNFITMGTTQFQYVAYAQFAKSVDAENIVGIVPVTLGGTGVNSLTGLKTALALNNVNNTTDLTKPISTLTQTALDLKLNAADTSKYTKQTYSDSALLTKLSTTGNAATATTAGNITATTNTTLTSLSNLATVGTITSGVWSGTAVAVEKGGTGATTASAARTNLGLVIGTDVQAPLVAGTDYLIPTGSAASLTNFPTFNQSTTGNAATATTAGNITATTNTTLTSLSSLATVGTITSGVWSGTAVTVEKGGTGATTASAARTNLGLVIGTDVQAPLVAGTNYLAPTGSAASLTNFPTFNQNTTGNAATATTAGNITATTNTTLTSLSSLATVGTITSGVWSGTAVTVEKGGTGATTASAARTNLGLEIGTNVQAPLVAGTDYLAPTGSAASLTNFPTLNQNTTGNAATATTAGNITATTNTTLISLSNLATVGTITSGVWSGTAVAIAKGGTGLTSAGNNGQVLTSTGSGTLTWTGTHYIGETYGGGKVFYVYDNGKHGLIAATSDQSTGIRWYGGSNTNTRARGDGVGAGLKNTAIIIANQGAVDGNAFAATVCNEYSVTVDGVTYADWYLPSKHELNLLYLQKTVVGGFADNFYWSSTEGGANYAWIQGFGSGSQLGPNKNGTGYVRAIRAF
jgi:hypothetical protein